MKKLTLLFTICILFVACVPISQKNSTEAKIEQKQATIPERKIEPFLNKIFINEYPNYQNNELVKDKALRELMSKIDSLAPLKYLEEIPLKIFRIQKNPHGKGAIVQFYSDNSGAAPLSDRLGFDIIGLMSEDIASSLNENSKYLISGKKYNRLDKTKTYLIVPQSYYSPIPEISKNTSTGVFAFNIGIFICEVDSIKQTYN